MRNTGIYYDNLQALVPIGMLYGANADVSTFIVNNILPAAAGNIVGGGDYSVNRIIPDLVRSVINSKPILIRQPNSSRPWQHVLSLIHGYFLLLTKENLNTENIYECWNFGPSEKYEFTVNEIIELFASRWQSPKIQFVEKNFKESEKLQIDSSKAESQLNWKTKWDYRNVFINTIDWYKTVHTTEITARKISELQLEQYRSMHNK
jgi:CDP-glucose 4,6-dehydratase